MSPGEVTRSLQRIEGQLQVMSGRIEEDFRNQRHKVAGIDTSVAALVATVATLKEGVRVEFKDIQDRFKADITRIEAAQIAFRNLLLVTMVGLIANVAVVLITRS